MSCPAQPCCRLRALAGNIAESAGYARRKPGVVHRAKRALYSFTLKSRSMPPITLPSEVLGNVLRQSFDNGPRLVLFLTFTLIRSSTLTVSTFGVRSYSDRRHCSMQTSGSGHASRASELATGLVAFCAGSV